MEQTTQQNIQKPFLPIKTKIAAWWMIVTFGLCSIIASLPIFYIVTMQFMEGVSSDMDILVWSKNLLLGLICLFLIPSLFIFPGIFLLKGKRWGWYLAIIIFSILLLFSTSLLILLIREAFLLSPEQIRDSQIRDFLIIFILIFILILPFTLLLIDRKNFWKIAS
jgi:hypothetical protein